MDAGEVGVIAARHAHLVQPATDLPHAGGSEAAPTSHDLHLPPAESVGSPTGSAVLGVGMAAGAGGGGSARRLPRRRPYGPVHADAENHRVRTSFSKRHSLEYMHPRGYSQQRHRILRWIGGASRSVGAGQSAGAEGTDIARDLPGAGSHWRDPGHQPLGV